MAEKIPNPLYTIRQVPSDKSVFNISKLDKDFGMVEMYGISENQKTGECTCSCPSRFIPCKHVKLLKHARAAEDNYQSLYWHVAPNAKWIKSYTAEQVGITT